MARNIFTEAFHSLARGLNKARGREEEENMEGPVGDRLPELDLDMEDSKLVDLSDTWERTWNESEVKKKFETKGEDNEKYWEGDQFDKPKADKSRPLVDNVMWEGLETYLPRVTRRNPEAMVTLASGVEMTPENEQWARALQRDLGEWADEVKLRLKLKGVARHHEVYLLGAAKMSWDLDRDIPLLKVVRPRKLILDPAAVTDEDGYNGNRIGEHRKLPAWQLIKFIEGEAGYAENKKAIEDMVKNDMATEVSFVEWWTPDYTFWKLGNRILRKKKNPHWNYDTEQAPAVTGESAEGVGLESPAEGAAGENEVVPQGTPSLPKPPPATVIPGFNHFKARKMPYILMAIYTLGKQPVNLATNMSQNLASQDLINKRLKQIDANADSMNGGMVVSLERAGLNRDQATTVTAALRRGGTVAIPAGAVGDAIQRMSAPSLPADVFNQLIDTRQRVRDVWGTSGLTPSSLGREKTVRGKYQIEGLDTDRIGGGISEALEQFADDVYNMALQMLYVYDDRFANAIAQGIVPPRVRISVKEGSLLPKDSTTIANQAIELSSAGKMSTIDLYKRLDYPNPEEMAANAWLEANAPELLFTDERVKQAIAARAQANGKPPSESINFKDLPPDGKTQMAAKVGIQLHPEAVAAHEERQEARSDLPALPDMGGGP